MRLWHYELLPYLPDAQFKGQLRELAAIMHDWRDKGKTNHLLINKVMEYPKSELAEYAFKYFKEYDKRYGKALKEKYWEFAEFGFDMHNVFIDDEIRCFCGWHNKEYLRVCMANLYEKHHFGIGKSRITDEEWKRLCDGYKAITGEEYKI
jgi:uncharacterized protein (TIGR02328 family)